MQQDTTKAIFFIIVSCLAFSVMNNIIRYASSDMNSWQMVFFRNVMSLLIISPFVLRKGMSGLKTSSIKLYFLRSLTGLIAMCSWFYSLALLPVAEATALGFTLPIFASLLAIIFFKEKADFLRILAIAIGFLGSLIILRPDSGIFGFGALVALFASFMMAVSSLLIKRLSKTDKAITMVFYMTAIMTPLSLPMAVIHWQPFEETMMLLMFGIGLTSTIGQYFLSRAYAIAEMMVLMPFDFFRLIFSASIAAIIFAEYPDMLTFVGAAVILTSAFFSIKREQRLKSLTTL